MQPNTCLNNNNLPGQCSAKSVLFVASDVVPNVCNKPWRLLSSSEIIQI